jgi:hypothetical protein
MELQQTDTALLFRFVLWIYIPLEIELELTWGDGPGGRWMDGGTGGRRGPAFGPALAPGERTRTCSSVMRVPGQGRELGWMLGGGWTGDGGWWMNK